VDAKILELKDGRKLGYAEYGKPDGIPVFYFHGTPGSRITPLDEMEIARTIGLRLIVPERPGFGFSDPKPNRTLLDWADDVVELAGALHIEKFGIIGVSGGGPYTAACAYKIPHHLTKAFIISSPAPFDAHGIPEELPTREEAEAFSRDFMQKFMGAPEAWYEGMMANAKPEERESLTHPQAKAFFIETFREGFRQGVEAYVDEIMLFDTQPWSFPIEAINADVYIWHGDLDNLENARYLSERIPNAKLHWIPDTGHFVPLQAWNGIFKAMIE
jgi:pimeloyl-ACP methyl ester carboxylesterase